jgi:hypothetical protein
LEGKGVSLACAVVPKKHGVRVLLAQGRRPPFDSKNKAGPEMALPYFRAAITAILNRLSQSELR